MEINKRPSPRDHHREQVLAFTLPIRDNAGMRTDLHELRRSRTAILAATTRWGAHSVRVFGSVARGEATESSDVDLLVAFEPDRSLLDQVHLIADLDELLGRRVDVVAEGGLLTRDDHILSEAVPL